MGIIINPQYHGLGQAHAMMNIFNAFEHNDNLNAAIELAMNINDVVQADHFDQMNDDHDLYDLPPPGGDVALGIANNIHEPQ